MAPTTPSLLHELTDHPIETGTASAGWRAYRIQDRGTVEILDVRQDVPDGILEAAIPSGECDVILLILNSSDADLSFASAFESASRRIARLRMELQRDLPVIALSFNSNDAQMPPDLTEILRTQTGFFSTAGFALTAESRQIACETICSSLPLPARLEFARFTMARGAQTEIAERLLKSFAALCGLIAVQPIPLADLPILTALQSLMVSLIVYVSGRQVSPKLAGEFAAAVGINVGAGFVFREGARAVAKLIPVWGSAVSGVVAGAGTYAIGRAAIAYFIDGKSGSKTLKEIRRRFPLLNRH